MGNNIVHKNDSIKNDNDRYMNKPINTFSNTGKLLFSSKNSIKAKNINDTTPDKNSILINFFFLFSTGQKFQVSGNPNDLFKTVLNNFISDQCPSDYKNKIKTALYNGAKADENKSLKDNKIEEGSKVLLIILDSINTDKETYDAMIKQPAARPKLSDSTSTLNSILSLDSEDIFLLMKLYDFIQKLNEIKNSSTNINSSEEDKLECSHIHSKIHEHGLVLLFSNRDWICNICKEFYSKDESKYYCSLCNFDVCNCCIGLVKKYPLNQFYHQQTKLEKLKFPDHEHEMVYCRTSRDFNNLSKWFCNNCHKTYSNKIWSFYCTKCDYDICLKCSKEYIDSDLLVHNTGIKIDNHSHRLVYMITNKDWTCDLCEKSFDDDIPTYYCTKCNYNVCENCMEKLSDEKKYPLDDEGERENNDIKTIDVDCHEHPLVYCLTSRSENKETTWICNKCLKHYEDNEWSFYCTSCDYDLCYECYENMNERLIIFLTKIGFS